MRKIIFILSLLLFLPIQAKAATDINALDIYMNPSDIYSGYQYKLGKAVKAEIRIFNNDMEELVQGRDFTLTYKNNKKVGKATVIITGKGNYSGTVTKEYNITKRFIYNCADIYIYANKVKRNKYKDIIKSRFSKKPKVEIYYCSKLKKGKDYTITYKKYKKRTDITIKGKGNFKGSIKFSIVPNKLQGVRKIKQFPLPYCSKNFLHNKIKISDNIYDGTNFYAAYKKISDFQALYNFFLAD